MSDEDGAWNFYYPAKISQAASEEKTVQVVCFEPKPRLRNGGIAEVAKVWQSTDHPSIFRTTKDANLFMSRYAKVCFDVQQRHENGLWFPYYK